MNHNVSAKLRKRKGIRARERGGNMRKRNPVRYGCPPGVRYQMRQRRRRTANDASRRPASLDLSKLQLILPVQSAKRRLFGPRFFRSAASFSQQIPKLICERSCRMAKTLTVNITPFLKKESRKRKKNKKKIHFFPFFEKNTGKNRFWGGRHHLKYRSKMI